MEKIPALAHSVDFIYSFIHSVNMYCNPLRI